MSSGAPVPIPPSDSRAYKRSWRNLLINKQVQLRFTLFMVGLSALLMALLGVWVKRVADNTTEVGLARVRGEICPPLPPAQEEANAPPAREGAAGAEEGVGATAAAPVEEPHPSVPTEVGEPAPGEVGAPARARGRVQLEESSMTLTPAGPQELRARVLAYWECVLRQKGLITDLTSRRRNIVWVLFASGLFLCAGLAIFGIKMTHRVAGPLHKITQYFGKMQQGRYGQVYPLRKGDELLEFYEHFKAAHDGVRTAEEADLAKIRAVLAAAKGRTLDPELQKKLQALTEVADRKERSLQQGEGA